MQHIINLDLTMERNDALSVEAAARALLATIAPTVAADVRHNREEGATWAQIGAGLGISAQAAHRRFKKP